MLSPSPYFQALLPGRWKRENVSETIDVPDMDGRIFFYVLYYLRVDDLPRTVGGSAFYRSHLCDEDIDELQLQADFLGWHDWLTMQGKKRRAQGSKGLLYIINKH